jgi:3-phosphoshikimate 1-carboxyvinyltransferase
MDASIVPARAVRGRTSVPGDKSISHRYAILAALAEGSSEIMNFSAADDCQRTVACLRALGVTWEARANAARIAGAGANGLRAPQAPLDAGNSGTTMRLLAGVLAGQPFSATLTGDRSLCRRPMRRIIEPLSQMGAQFEARDDNFAPLHITGGHLHPIAYTLPVASAQVKSAILFAGLFADGRTSVTEPTRTRDHTERALAQFGAAVERDGLTARIHGRARLQAQKLIVPGDFSAAIFFLAAALVLEDSELVLDGVGLNPTRTAALDFLISMGAPVRLDAVSEPQDEPRGEIAIRHARLAGGTIRGPQAAWMIDELPMLAALAPYTDEGIEIRDASELRFKESDRIATVADNLRRMGASVEMFPDGLRVAGRAAGQLAGAEIDPRGDHRIAMAFAIAALGARGETRIRDADCVAVSFPDFFPRLEAIVERG